LVALRGDPPAVNLVTVGRFEDVDVELVVVVGAAEREERGKVAETTATNWRPESVV
jgi:hypothetical protein